MKMSEEKIPGPTRDFVGYGRHVPKVSWPDDARVAVNLVINYEEGSEVQMSADQRNESILGEMSLGLEAQYRDLALESVYEYGSRAGIWRLQRVFDLAAGKLGGFIGDAQFFQPLCQCQVVACPKIGRIRRRIDQCDLDRIIQRS